MKSNGLDPHTQSVPQLVLISTLRHLGALGYALSARTPAWPPRLGLRLGFWLGALDLALPGSASSVRHSRHGAVGSDPRPSLLGSTLSARSPGVALSALPLCRGSLGSWCAALDEVESWSALRRTLSAWTGSIASLASDAAIFSATLNLQGLERTAALHTFPFRSL